MDLEQTVKDLQNVEFQQMFLTLAKGQEDLKTLLIEEKKKKTMKATGVLNLGRRFPGAARKILDFATSSGEKDNQEGKGKEATAQPESEEEEEEDYSEEQYPPADDKYKYLEERLSAMEIQKVLGMDFEELVWCLGLLFHQSSRHQCLLSTTGFRVPRCISDLI